MTRITSIRIIISIKIARTNKSSYSFHNKKKRCKNDEAIKENKKTIQNYFIIS